MRIQRWVQLLIMAALSTAHAAPGDTPRETVDAFLQLYLSKLSGSFPDAPGREALRPLVTPRFARLLEGAADGIDCQQKATGGNEPPPSQGDIFVSSFEGATSADGVTQTKISSTRATFTIHWRYTDNAPGRDSQEPVKWSDRLLLKKLNGRWLIDDFTHDGNWDFMIKGTTASHLKWVATFCKRS
jgi:hypothetical protein